MTCPDLSDAAVGGPEGPSDRRLRAIDAFIDLMLDGGATATPSDIAEKVGVSRATFFRYFATLEELRNAALVRVAERFPDLHAVPGLGEGTRDERIARFVEARVQLHETLHPLALLFRTRAGRDAEAAELLDAARQVLAGQVAQHFAVELAQHTPARRDDLVVAISVLTSVESWQQFRQTHDRSRVQTQRAWRDALGRLLVSP